MLIEVIWSILFAITVIPFGLYILYMRRVAENREYGIKLDPTYEPTISVVIPTYQEAKNIESKLENILAVDYPKSKLEVLVVDSASKDATIALTEQWAKKHPELKIKVIRQPVRKGMVNAVVEALENATCEVFLKTDVDCMIEPGAIKKALKYLADPTVGSVAGLPKIVSKKETVPVKAEEKYKDFYNILRIGESKLYGTVLYEGELMLVKIEILRKIGFDQDVGGDDVATAIKMASIGYRALTAEDAFFLEKTPYTWKERNNQKIRRARHVFQALWKYKYLINKKDTSFHKLALPFETFIYVFNPFFVLFLMIVSVPFIVLYPWLLFLLLLLLVKPIREMLITFISSNLIMVRAILKESRKREGMVWEISSQIRE